MLRSGLWGDQPITDSVPLHAFQSIKIDPVHFYFIRSVFGIIVVANQTNTTSHCGSKSESHCISLPTSSFYFDTDLNQKIHIWIHRCVRSANTEFQFYKVP